MEVKSNKFYRTESVTSVDLLSEYTNKISNLINLKKESVRNIRNLICNDRYQKYKKSSAISTLAKNFLVIKLFK